MSDEYARVVWSYIQNTSLTERLIVGAVSLYAFYRLVIKKTYKLPPGPRALPLLGNLLALQNSSMLDKLNEWQKNIEGNMRGEYMVAIFLDLEKAFGTTWKFGIPKDLHEMGLRDQIPLLIKECLKERSLQVKGLRLALGAFRTSPVLSLYAEGDEHPSNGGDANWLSRPMRTIVINDIDLVTEAFVAKSTDFSDRPFIYSFDKFTEGSKGITMARYGDTWKYQKKVAAKSLRQYLLGQQFEERCHEVIQLVSRDLEAMMDQPIILKDVVSLCVFNVIHGLCFGSTKDFNDPAFTKMSEAFESFNTIFGNGLLEDIFPPLRLCPTKSFREAFKKLDWVLEYVQQQLSARKADLNEDSIQCLSDSILLLQKELKESDSASIIHMTDSHARQIVLDVFGASVDTSRSTLDWIFLVLIGYPDVQARMHTEIDQVVGAKIPGKEHRSKLIYTEAVILETMRLYAVAPLGVPHTTSCDTSVGGYDIPAKTSVMISQHLVLRDPKHWEDPLTFKPERFMTEGGTKIVVRNPSFIPFSTGPRSCPGESLAKLEIVYLVVGLLQKFSFSLPPGDTADFTPVFNFFGIRPLPFKAIVKAR